MHHTWSLWSPGEEEDGTKEAVERKSDEGRDEHSFMFTEIRIVLALQLTVW